MKRVHLLRLRNYIADANNEFNFSRGTLCIGGCSVKLWPRHYQNGHWTVHEFAALFDITLEEADWLLYGGVTGVRWQEITREHAVNMLNNFIYHGKFSKHKITAAQIAVSDEEKASRAPGLAKELQLNKLSLHALLILTKDETDPIITAARARVQAIMENLK